MLADRVRLKEGWIYEVVVESSKSHAAPMGVRFGGGDTIFLEAYRSSKTCRNIQRERECRVYFVDDVTVLKEVLDSKRLAKKKAGAILSVSVTGEKEAEDKIIFQGKIVDWKTIKNVKPINRAEALTLEALIESTKPKPDRKKLGEFLRVVRKAAPNSTYEKIIRETLLKCTTN